MTPNLKGKSPIKVRDDGFSFREKDLEENAFYPFKYDGSKFMVQKVKGGIRVFSE